ncbi:hypothetical protein BDV24DRAFT_72149 [Aspergillus arachidicola]|uniref:Uncharacterized protein n=1 Tax=Aspergillus arachidicola TaxID=656916 RepID=A0A5N6Y3G8_9EURO|nr:hypothetical protein BDV24DRAFT_72149 [Aspergillus arachidicola]
MRNIVKYTGAIIIFVAILVMCLFAAPDGFHPYSMEHTRILPIGSAPIQRYLATQIGYLAHQKDAPMHGLKDIARAQIHRLSRASLRP